MTDNKKHLYYMNELSDYKISDGYPDVRGWAVKDVDNRVIGKVDNLLVNVDAQRVVYLDVEVDHTIIDAKHDPYGRPSHLEVREFVNKDGENHIIIPIGLVDLNTDSDYVYTDIIDHRTFSETKRYRKGENLDRAYEVQVLDSYERRTRDRDYHDDVVNKEKVTYDDIPSESRIREIVRQEIRDYHHDKRTYDSAYSKEAEDAVVITDEELELERRRRNDDVYDDDHFYERREFENRNFRKKRTPGL